MLLLLPYLLLLLLLQARVQSCRQQGRSGPAWPGHLCCVVIEVTLQRQRDGCTLRLNGLHAQPHAPGQARRG